MIKLVWFLTNFSATTYRRIYSYSPGIIEFFTLVGFLFLILHIFKKRKRRQEYRSVQDAGVAEESEELAENNPTIKPVAELSSTTITTQSAPVEKEGIVNSTYRLSDENKRGECAERDVAQVLSLLDARRYTVFNNVVVPSFLVDGIKTAQIDHLVVPNFGVFCVETKAHAGAVYGDRKHQNWIYYLGKESYKIYSPVRQNYYHIKTLNRLIGDLLNKAIESYIVFVNARKIKVKDINNIGNIEDLICFLSSKREIIYNDQEKQKIIARLEEIIQDQTLRRILHTEDAKKYVAMKNRY